MSARKRVVLSLAGLTVVSTVFLAVYMFRTHSTDYSFMWWNLFLAWVPLGLSTLLLKVLEKRLWSHWLSVFLTLVWLLMLPNSFYMISDFIHIHNMSPQHLLYGVVTFTAFIFTAAFVGFASLYQVHAELRKRFRQQTSSLVVAAILFVCSFAIYLGRDLRWNSWDVLLNPSGILFDVSDRVIHPLGHPGTLSTTLSFFVLLGSLYVVGWQVGEATRTGTRQTK